MKFSFWNGFRIAFSDFMRIIREVGYLLGELIFILRHGKDKKG